MGNDGNEYRNPRNVALDQGYRRDGHGKLVYNKETRTIDTVRSTDIYPLTEIKAALEKIANMPPRLTIEQLVDQHIEMRIVARTALDAMAAIPAIRYDGRDNSVEALREAIRIADEARNEWDMAPSGMKAGKLLIALSGHLPGYRADIDAIHAAINLAST